MAGESMLSSAIGFGIKEVADVGFYEVGKVNVDEVTGAVTGTPLFILDTLKVSTLENTAEQTEARGGKGNASLIIWDHSREITVTLQDAVLSEKTLSMMFEGNAKDSDNCIRISAQTFPGTYAIVGKTFARDIVDGKDHMFTWYVPKAKVNSEVTITMEAEGDPTVFDMNLRVLRDSNGTMVKLIKNKDAADVNSYSAEEALSGAVSGEVYIVSVKDSKGSPVAGAEVSLEDHKAITDLYGYADFKGFVAANTTLTVTKEGYSSAEGNAVAGDVTSITLTA